ncbi:MAG: hypothetical protein EXQ79_04740 [Acidimicrobiia bacterium]|nr:hypothetical protein [Acidimicrobiia bacterium]
MPEILRLFHGSQIVPDVLEAGRFYHDFFGSWVYEAQHLDAEDSRNSANLLGGEFSIELLAPLDPLADTGAARFLRRHGPHFNNVAFWARDCRGLAQRCLDRGVRVAVRGQGFSSSLPPATSFDYVITHPKDTHGLVLEFLEDQPIHDPRHRPWWDSSYWRDQHPLGIDRLSHATVVLADLGAASACFHDVLGGTRVEDVMTADLDAATNSAGAWFAIGDSIIELAAPRDASSARARHLTEHGSMLYSFTFAVRDIEAVVAHAETCRIGVARYGAHLVELDPADTCGSVYAFTDRPVAPVEEHPDI